MPLLPELTTPALPIASTKETENGENPAFIFVFSLLPPLLFFSGSSPGRVANCLEQLWLLYGSTPLCRALFTANRMRQTWREGEWRKNKKESANDCKPVGANRRERREAQGGPWLRCSSLSAVAVTMQLGSAEWWGGCSPLGKLWASLLSQAASETAPCHHYLPQPKALLHRDTVHIQAQGCTEPWHPGWVGIPLPGPCRAAGGSGREQSSSEVVRAAVCGTPGRERSHQLGWKQWGGLASFFNRLQHCGGGRLSC